MRLRDERAHTGVDLSSSAAHLSSDGEDRLDKSAIACTSSIVSLGCPIMKYSFNVCQPRAKDLASRCQHLLCADRLVDDLTHAFGGRFRCEGEPAAMRLRLKDVHQLRREGLDPQRRQRDVEVAVSEAIGDGLHQRQNLVVVRGGEREQAHFLVTSCAQRSIDGVYDFVHRALPHGPGDHSSLTEATAAVQPRMISIGTRLWVTSMYGTTNLVGGGGSYWTIRLSTGKATPSSVGDTFSTVPSRL